MYKEPTDQILEEIYFVNLEIDEAEGFTKGGHAIWANESEDSDRPSEGTCKILGFREGPESTLAIVQFEGQEAQTVEPYLLSAVGE